MNTRPTPEHAPERTPGLIVGRFATAVRLRPVCMRGRIARGWFNLKDRCEVCGTPYGRSDHGNWLVAATINYFFNVLVCTSLNVVLVRRYGFFGGLTFVIVGAALFTTALRYRPTKALGLWVLWVFGLVA